MVVCHTSFFQGLSMMGMLKTRSVLCSCPSLQAGCVQDPHGLRVAILQWENRVLEGKDDLNSGGDYMQPMIFPASSSSQPSIPLRQAAWFAWRANLSLPPSPSTCRTLICHLSWVTCRALGAFCCSCGLSSPKHLVCQKRAASKSRGLPAQPVGAGR